VRPTRDDDLTRQGLLLLAFDLLVVAAVMWSLALVVPSALPIYAAVILAAGGLLTAMATLVVVGRRHP
jgi:uncharacterized YccA/Bax inhibitor family protein